MKKAELFARFYNSWRGLNAVYEQYARDAGISYANLQVLSELVLSTGEITQHSICEKTRLQKTTVNAIVKTLCESGLLECRSSPDDRRKKVLCLTESGRAYAGPIMERLTAAETRAFDELSLEDADAMLRGLERYEAALKRETGQAPAEGEPSRNGA